MKTEKEISECCKIHLCLEWCERYNHNCLMTVNECVESGGCPQFKRAILLVLRSRALYQIEATNHERKRCLAACKDYCTEGFTEGLCMKEISNPSTKKVEELNND